MITLITSILNLLRLLLLFLLFLLLSPFLKKRAIFFFLKLAGPSFIKLGQALSTRPDLVGEHLAEILSHFQDRLTPFSSCQVKKILRREFGENFEKIFADFNYVAQASASIAQVHRAKIFIENVGGKKVNQDGRGNSKNHEFNKEGSWQDVAVKILRPNIKKIVARDIATLALIANITRLFSKFTAKTLKDINSVLKESTKSELNLLKEAANAMRLKDNLQGLQGFYVPQIFLKFSTSNILVSEWINGVPFSNKRAIHNTSFDKSEVAKNLVISYFTQVYSDGFFHADMHPGNLFLMDNGAHAGSIAVVDFGIMGEIDKKTRLAVAEIFIGFLHKDYKRVAQLHIDAGLVPSGTNVYDLALSCQKIGETIVGSSVQEISLATLLAHLIEMTREYKMDTKPNLLLLQKTLLLVEGVGVMLDKNLNIWELARPWVKEWAKKNIGFDAKIRDALVGLFEAIKAAIPKNRD